MMTKPKGQWSDKRTVIEAVITSGELHLHYVQHGAGWTWKLVQLKQGQWKMICDQHPERCLRVKLR